MRVLQVSGWQPRRDPEELVPALSLFMPAEVHVVAMVMTTMILWVFEGRVDAVVNVSAAGIACSITQHQMTKMAFNSQTIRFQVYI